MRRLAWFTSIILGTLAVLFLLWEFRSAVWIFLFSLAAAATFRPPIKQLTKRGLSLSMALLLVYGAVVLVVGGLLIVVSFNLLTELQDLANRFAIGYQHIEVVWPEGTPLQQAVASRLPTSDTLYDSIMGDNGLSTLPSVLEITSNLAENLTYLVIVLFLGIYWTVDQVRFERLLLSLIPIENRAPAREMWRQIETNVGSYLRSELIQSLLAGLLLGLGYWLIGLQYPTLLALIGAVVWLIPIMGVLLALIPVIIVGIISGLWVGLIAGGYTLLVFWLLEYIIEPRFYDRRRFSSLLLLLVMLAAHGSYHRWERLIWAADVRAVIRTSPELDMDRLRALARRTGAMRMLELALCMAERLEPLPHPLREMIPDRGPVSRLADHPPSRLYYHFKVRERWRDRMCCLFRYFFAPTFSDWKCISLPAFLSWLYYLIRPFRAVRDAIKKTRALMRGSGKYSTRQVSSQFG